MKILPDTALTYDDVLLVPQYSNVDSRRSLSTKSWLTKKIALQMPIVSANMDVVTESEMAITMAREGGIPSPFASFAGNFVSRGGLIGLGLTASSAISRFGQGQTAAGVANLAGSIGGAVLGNLAGPAGPIVGSVIGTAIADSFAKAAMEHEEDFQSLFSDVYKEVREDTEDKPKVGEAIRTEAERTIYELIGAGNEAVGRWGIEMGTTLENAIYRALGGLPDELNKALQDVGLGIEGEFQGLTELQAAYLNAYRAGKITPDVNGKITTSTGIYSRVYSI